MTKEKNEIVESEKEDITIVIDGTEFKAKHRTFSSGKKGYGVYGITKIKGYPHRISLNLIEVGS
jgi:hypothetical protein